MPPIKPGRWSANPADVAPEFQDLWKGLIHLIPFWGESPEDLIPGNAPLLTSANRVVEPKSSGLGHKFITDSDIVDLQHRFTADIGSVMVVWEGVNGGGGTTISRKLFATENDDTGLQLTKHGTSYNWEVQINNDGANGFNSFFSPQGDWPIGSASSYDGRTHVVLVSWVSEEQAVSLWWDGKSFAPRVDTGWTDFGEINTGGGVLNIGNRNYSAFRPLDGHIFAFAGWDRALTDGEARLLSQDPFGLLRPSPRAGLLAEDRFIQTFGTSDVASRFVVNERDETTTPPHLTLDGTDDYIQTTDKAQLDVTGDIDMIACIRVADWTPTNEIYLINKWDFSTQKSYTMRFTSAGQIGINWSSDGTSDTGNQVSNQIGQSFIPNEWVWLRLSFDVNNGAGGHDLRYFFSLDPPDNPVGSVVWLTAGEDLNLSGTTSIFAGTAVLTAFGRSAGGAERGVVGDAIKAYVYSGIPSTPGDPPSGTLVAAPDISDPTQGWFTPPASDGVGNSWTLVGSTSWVPESRLWIATDNTLGFYEGNGQPDAWVFGEYDASLNSVTDLDLISYAVYPRGRVPQWGHLLSRFYTATGNLRVFTWARETEYGSPVGWAGTGAVPTIDGHPSSMSVRAVNPSANARNASSGSGFIVPRGRWYRVTFDVNNGGGSSEYNFYYSDESPWLDPKQVTWTQHGAALLPGGTFTLNTTTDTNTFPTVGNRNDDTALPDEGMQGKILCSFWRDAIGSNTYICAPDFRGNDQTGGDSTGMIWTPGAGMTWREGTLDDDWINNEGAV